MKSEAKIILGLFNFESSRRFVRELELLGVTLRDKTEVFCG